MDHRAVHRVADETTVSDLLDDVYFAMAPQVRPFQYLKIWALETEQGEILDSIGTIWASKRGQTRDLRKLPQVGIVPGARLRVVRYP